MNCSACAVGIYTAKNGERSPRLVLLEARHGVDRERLHPTLVECLDESAAAIAHLTGGALEPDPAAWGVAASIDVELLQGHSYGLAVFASMAASILGTGTRDAVACTGRVNSDGTVSAIGELALKAEVDGDARYLVVPRENDPHDHLIVPGVRVLHTESVEDILWLLLDTPYLGHIVQHQAKIDAWPFVDSYLERCLKNGLLPRCIGQVARKSMENTDLGLGLAIAAHRSDWEDSILRLAPISEPDPSDLIQGLFPDVDWSRIQVEDPPRAEHMVADLAKALVLRNQCELARNLCNLVFLGRDGNAILAEVGPLRQFVFWAAQEFQRTGDRHNGEVLFAGPLGVGRRLQTAGVPDEELRSRIMASPLETEIIHGRADGKIELRRLIYRLNGVQMDFAVDHPMALIDGSYSVPSFLRKPDWNQHMDATYGHPEGQIMLEHFGRQTFVVNHFDTRLAWSSETQCWPPSVDSLHFIADVYNAGLHEIDGGDARVLDLCCGCGVVGLSLARVGNFRDVDFVDFEPGACTITRINIEQNFPGVVENCEVETDDIEQTTRYTAANGRAFVVRQGEATRILARIVDQMNDQTRRYDRVFFTPPYVPEPDLLHVPLWRATAGTDLMEACIAGGSRFCKEMIFTYSRMAESAVERGLQRCGELELDEVIGSHWVALRIPGMVDVFDIVKSGDRAGQIPHAAERYWNMYLANSMKETGELHAMGELPHDGHGFRFAKEILTRRVVFR